MRYSNTIAVRRNGTILFKGKIYPCAIGKGGFVTPEAKTEGDGGTPTGTYPLRACFYRADRVQKPKFPLPTYEVTPAFGWCDDPNHPEYNRPVVLPFDARHEELWRTDACYDIVVIIGYNDQPVAPGKGSAIFFHLTDGKQYKPTEGCVAVSQEHMQEILAGVTLTSQIKLGA